MKNLIYIISILTLISCSKRETQFEQLNMSFTIPAFLEPCGEPKEALLIINGIEHRSNLKVIAGGWRMESILVEEGKSIITKLILIDHNGNEMYNAVGYMDRYRFDLISESNPIRVLRYTDIGAGVAVICCGLN